MNILLIYIDSIDERSIFSCPSIWGSIQHIIPRFRDSVTCSDNVKRGVGPAMVCQWPMHNINSLLSWNLTWMSFFNVTRSISLVYNICFHHLTLRFHFFFTFRNVGILFFPSTDRSPQKMNPSNPSRWRGSPVPTWEPFLGISHLMGPWVHGSDLEGIHPRKTWPQAFETTQRDSRQVGPTSAPQRSCRPSGDGKVSQGCFQLEHWLNNFYK